MWGPGTERWIRGRYGEGDVAGWVTACPGRWKGGTVARHEGATGIHRVVMEPPPTRPSVWVFQAGGGGGGEVEACN